MTYSKLHRYRGRPKGLGDGLDDFLYALGIGSEKPAPSDKVNQTASGGTTTTAADFTQVGGVCKPKNFPTLEACRLLQSQLNRVAHVKKLSKTAVDGAIGSGTLALYRQVQSAAKGSIMGDPSTCMGVAPDVDILAAQVKDFADSLGAPAQVSGPITLSVPTIVTDSGKTVVAPGGGIAATLAAMTGTEKLAIAGIAGTIGYLLMTAKRRRRSS